MNECASWDSFAGKSFDWEHIMLCGVSPKWTETVLKTKPMCVRVYLYTRNWHPHALGCEHTFFILYSDHHHHHHVSYNNDHLPCFHQAWVWVIFYVWLLVLAWRHCTCWWHVILVANANSWVSSFGDNLLLILLHKANRVSSDVAGLSCTWVFTWVFTCSLINLFKPIPNNYPRLHW